MWLSTRNRKVSCIHWFRRRYNQYNYNYNYNPYQKDDWSDWVMVQNVSVGCPRCRCQLYNFGLVAFTTGGIFSYSFFFLEDSCKHARFPFILAFCDIYIYIVDAVAFEPISDCHTKCNSLKRQAALFHGWSRRCEAKVASPMGNPKVPWYGDWTRGNWKKKGT